LALYFALCFGIIAVFFTGGAVVPELFDYLLTGEARGMIMGAGLLSLVGQIVLGIGVVRKLKSERYDRETVFIYLGLTLNTMALLGVLV
jgi:hypothetical protein